MTSSVQVQVAEVYEGLRLFLPKNKTRELEVQQPKSKLTEQAMEVCNGSSAAKETRYMIFQ